MTTKKTNKNKITEKLTPEAISYCNKLANYYLDITNKTIEYLNQSSDQLSNLLVTISLAYVALMMAAFNDPNNIQKLSISQCSYVIIGDTLFIISIICGIIRWIMNIRFLNKTHRATSRIHDKLEVVQTMADIKSIEESEIIPLQQDKCRKSLIWPMMAQIILFGLGMITALLYITSTVWNS